MSNIEKIIVVASKNPVKVEAALTGFSKIFPDCSFRAVPVSVPSDVADQPMTDAETLMGATNRVNHAFAAYPEADFWIGIEGGVQFEQDELAALAWVVVRSGTQLGKARSGTFFLPKAIADLVAQGMELGQANDIVFSKSNSKQKSGAIGLLTDNAVDRTLLDEQAVVLALVSFKNPELYNQPEIVP
ncbi:inosine/xanthosine triphosphatase [Adhaeribacter aquaticus]|uniref:inosine/xanthosine triphosphatase n=1 Tax=Adhaeribacter aquaticus TaxID=299567 RepID=UPI00047DE4A2|nr:inosine/xanthosine triphosphatase [Adhaeribacter aquaticus]